MFSRAIKEKSPTIEGGSFRRFCSLGVTETAKVIAIVRDGGGIAHVQFNLEFARRGEMGTERRTLALDYFRSLYTEAAD